MEEEKKENKVFLLNKGLNVILHAVMESNTVESDNIEEDTENTVLLKSDEK